MKWNAIILLLLVFIGSGCSRGGVKIQDIPVIKIDLKRNDDPSKINDFFKYSHYVPLETSDSCIIREINKLQIINDKIYIADRKQATIFIFDMEGNLISSIRKQGKAKNEYIYLSDFETLPDGRIFIYDATLGAIIIYDESGKFQKRISNLYKGWSIKLLDDDYVAYNLGNGIGDIADKEEKYNYVVCKGDEVIKEAVPFNKALIGRKYINQYYSSSFYQYDDNIYMSSMLNDTIYKVSESTGDITPYVVFDFNAKRPTIEHSNVYALDYMNTLISGDVPSTPYCFYDFHNAVMAFYDYDRKPHMVISSLNGDILYSGVTGEDLNGISTSFLTPYIDSDNTKYIINAVSPINMKNRMSWHKKNGCEYPLLNEISSHVGDEDNPVLIMYEWIY